MLIRTAPYFILVAALIGTCGMPAYAQNLHLNVVASVNGEKITSADLYEVMSHYIPSQVPNFPKNPMVDEPASHVALQFLIENKIVTQLASDKGVPVTAVEVASRYKDLKMIEESHVANSFEDGLVSEGYTQKTFKDEVIAPEVAKFNLLTRGLSASNSQLQAYFHSNIADFKTQARVHLERTTFADMATAKAAYASAIATGSLTAYASHGTQDEIDIPTWIGIDRPDNGMPADLVAQLRSAKPGEVLKPVMMGHWTVIRIVDKKPANAQKFADVRHLVLTQFLKKTAEQQNRAIALQRTLAVTIRRDSIESALPEFKKVIKQMKNQSMHAVAGA